MIISFKPLVFPAATCEVRNLPANTVLVCEGTCPPKAGEQFTVQCLEGNLAAASFVCPLNGPFGMSAANVKCPVPSTYGMTLSDILTNRLRACRVCGMFEDKRTHENLWTGTCGCGDRLGTCGADGQCTCPAGYVLNTQTLTCALSMPSTYHYIVNCRSWFSK
jgi:hypothetical protein